MRKMPPRPDRSVERKEDSGRVGHASCSLSIHVAGRKARLFDKGAEEVSHSFPAPSVFTLPDQEMDGRGDDGAASGSLRLPLA
jgi:hypothetical protein